MFKYAIIFLIVSLIAGAFGLTNVSRVAKRVSMVLFAMFSSYSSRSWALPIWPARRSTDPPSPRLRAHLHKSRVNAQASPARVATLMCHCRHWLAP
jgi:uncharacterized membrane protein YtjA (UPF0391 family)